jgi:thiamine-monophosphate kinase
MNEDEDRFRRRRAIEMRTPRDNRFQPHTPLGPGGEFDSIRRMLERWGPLARRIGDDAAVITSLGERSLVVSTDSSIENVHFKRDWLSPTEIGYRAAASALSDLAAMGAKPLGMLVAMAIPEEWRRHMDAISDGIGEAAHIAEAPILGGDMSRSTELALTISVLGTARDVLFRTGARPGDHVYVTGRLGGPGAALDALTSNREPQPAHRERFVKPVPRIREAMWLAEHGASAAIDISDGLSSDLCHVAVASRVAITIDLGALPLVEGVTSEAAASSGEEYEVVVTSNREIDSGEFDRHFNLDLTRIGVVERGDPGVTFVLEGNRVDIQRGYLHFG